MLYMQIIEHNPDILFTQISGFFRNGNISDINETHSNNEINR